MKIKLISKFSYFSIVLILIFVLGLAVRIIDLSNLPNGFSRDEAYLGYNAYSILKTGKDISGNFLPLFLESFLFTPAGYAYFSIPFIWLFDLNIISVRLASALFGALTVPVLAVLTTEILSTNKKTFIKNHISLIALTSAFLLAINPWHINLSRTASVSTLVTFFILSALLLLFFYLRKKAVWLLLFSFVLFFISLTFYIAPFSFLPQFLILFFILFFRIIKNKKIYAGLFLLLLAPIVLTYLNKDLSLRASSLSLFRHPLVPIMLSENASSDGVAGFSPFVSRVFHNKLTVVSNLYFQNYFQHLDYDFFFTDKSYPDRFRIPEVGLFVPIMLFPILAGIVFLFRRDLRLLLFLGGWVAISPMGSAFANDDVPNMQRILFMLPPLIIVGSCGWYSFLTIKNKIFSYLIVFFVSIIFVYQTVFFFHQYGVHLLSYRPWYRHDGYQKLTAALLSLNSKYKEIVITNRESAPTIFLSFFSSYNPSSLQSAIRKSSLKDTDRISFGKYHVTEEECPVRVELNEKGKKALIGKKNTLYVLSGNCKISEFEDRVKVIEEIKRGDGSIAFYVLEVK